jgi:hypothetical protein
VLRLDRHTGSSICGDVDKAAPTEVDRHVAVDESSLRVAISSVPVIVAVEIRSGRKARIVDVNPLVHRWLHIDGHAAVDDRTFDHWAFHGDFGRDDRGADGDGASEDESCRGSHSRHENE